MVILINMIMRIIGNVEILIVRVKKKCVFGLGLTIYL